MKLSVSAFRAQASAQRKILSAYQNQLNYGACSTFPALSGGIKLDEVPQMMVDKTGIGPSNTQKPNDQSQSSETSAMTSQDEADEDKVNDDKEDQKEKDKERERIDNITNQAKSGDEPVTNSDKSPGGQRTKSNQRWMKLRTTVQLSGAISSTIQKSKPPLKREDSFLKRFSTRQIPETQETVDTGDETEPTNGIQTQDEVNRRRRKRRKQLSRTVVNPDENFYFYWLMTVTVCVLYNLWTLIVRQSFPELQTAVSAFWYAADGLTDLVFVCDIMVQFRTGYLEQGLMVYDSKKLAGHYLKSRAFIFDLLSLLPLDLIQINVGVNPILRFPRFLKIYRVYNYYYIVESRTVYPNLWRVVNLIHILLILAHWFGCFYYLLSEAEGFQGDWVYPYRPGDYATLTRKYLGSLYWSTLTLTTIGDLPTPETNAESRDRSKAMTPSADYSHPLRRRGHKSRLLQFNSNSGYVFTIVSYLIGVFIFATIVGQVGNVITNRNANRLEFERLLDGAKTYMRHHKVPGGMKRRVLRWYDYSWSRGRIQGGGDINTALGLLPDKLKTELALHVNLSVLKKVTIFQECQPEFLHDLVLKMKAYIFTPGDLICRKGEVAREMFIIADGILDVISETGRVLTTMKAGDFFGEIGILNLDGLNKRTADVRSVGYSELFSLSREDVLTAMKDYPEAQEILQSLGRKRLMEAKNASKMHRAQAKQVKDHDSSGDSDTAGKRIVEKLRSDVKGLKNALRRSRRGTRTKDSMDGINETNVPKTQEKKHCILRRMSHVQSSDECEINNDIAQSPIGAGLPLLQRLKLLKEKQEKEREEKEKMKPPPPPPSTAPSNNEEKTEPEVIGAGLPLTQRLKLLKQREEREAAAVAAAATGGDGMGNLPSSTVRTQLPGLRFDKSLSKSKLLSSGVPGDLEIQKIEEELKTSEENDSESETPPPSKKSENISSLREKLKSLHTAQSKEKITPLIKNAQDSDSISPSSRNILLGNIQPETSNNVPIKTETANLVPNKPLESKSEVPKSKDSWGILKKSSIRGFKYEKKPKNEEEKLVRKVSKKGTYLSKSDTVLEKQTSMEKREKRSRSISPSECRKRTWKGAVEKIIMERRRTKSLSQANKKNYDEIVDVNAWEFPEAAFKHLDPSADSTPKSRDSEMMKKYDSIDDLSPEYSGLPFVKKLKILNERQKLAELEKELVVRSASLDVPERSPDGDEVMLIRSQSEASAIELKKGSGRKSKTPPSESWRNVAAFSGESSKSVEEARSSDSPSEVMKRSDSVEKSRKMRKDSEGSIGSLPSPESNETMERRHLKSILKRLSAEDSASDEDQCSKNIKRTMSLKKSGHVDLKKLMRAPTIEGYAARHTKLTKSVTFNRDTLQSPPESSPLEPTAEETMGKGFSPTSPTAILTLQLSNLSMIPIANPSKPGQIQEIDKPQEECKEQSTTEENIKFEAIIPKVIEKIQEEVQRFSKCEKEKDLPYVVQEISDRRNFRMLPYSKSQDEEYFGSVVDGIKTVIQGHLDEIQKKFESQFISLEMEVKKRDDIISQLQSKIQELEKSPVKSLLNRAEKSEDATTDSGGTDPELSDVPFLRGDSFETILGVTSPQGEPSSISTSPIAPVTVRSRGCSPIIITEENLSEINQQSDSDTPFDYLGNVIRHQDEKQDTSENDENEDDLFDIRDKIRLLSNSSLKDRGMKKRFRTPWDPQSDEELELLEIPKKPKSETRSYGTESKLKRNFSIDESNETTLKNRQRKKMSDVEYEEYRDKFDDRRNSGRFDPRPRGSLIDRFGRSFSRSTESRDFVALDIDDSSSSSDLEDSHHNKDWEIQMLAEELTKKEVKEAKKVEEEEEEDDDWEEEIDDNLEKLEEMKKLENEVNKLKQVVCESDLSRFSNSELDMLETIIEAKDQKIAQIAKSSSFESRNENFEKLKHFDSSGSEHSRKSEFDKPRELEQKRRTLKQKIGQAFSFDFHDIDNRKRKSPHEYGKRKSFSLRKQKTISGSYQERQSLDNLLHTSSFLRNRVLEDSSRARKNRTNYSSSTINSRSSLPILVSNSTVGKSFDIRTSLPTLTAKECQFKGNLKSNENLTSSISSSDDTFQESDFKESCDSVFEENSGYRDSNHLENETLLEIRNINYPTTSKTIRSDVPHSNNSLNNFIKTMGQKVKQAVVGDMNTIKDQVPTISKLCDDQSILKQTDVECSDEILVRDPMASPEEEVKSCEEESSGKVLDSLDNNPRTLPPDL